MVTQIAAVLPGSFSALIVRHPFYEERYDYQPPIGEGRLRAKWRLHVGNAWLFARLARQAQGFIYLSQNGYLSRQDDSRRFEFSFLQRHGLKIVCYFTGNDIRSPKLKAQHELSTGIRNSSGYLRYSSPGTATASYEESKRELAAIADEFADLSFTFRVDQLGYLSRPSEAFMYFLPDDRLAPALGKFDDLARPVILHAPSKPIVKGTQLVRAAIDQLRVEGWDFEYVELANVPHTEVTSELRRAHIVLNQFYACAPGVFGVEAMAAGCVVLQSADEEVEPDLPAGSNKAWIVTKHWQVYRNLKDLLEHPERMRAQAESGQEWVRTHATASQNGASLRRLLERLV